jgi:threonine dehydratase
VIAGQGTIGAEILRQSRGRVDAVFVPVGGGGLISGIAGYLKALLPAVKIVGVEPFEADAMWRSLQAGKRVRLEHVGIFADGVAVRDVGETTFRIVRQCVDEIVRVTNDEICAAIKDVFDDTRSVMEPAGALGGGRTQELGGAGGQRRRRRAAGGDPLRRQHELRPACASCRAGRGGRAREALLGVTIPERPAPSASSAPRSAPAS